MEEKNTSSNTTETEFLELLELARNNDHNAILSLLAIFEPDMHEHSRYIKMPKEDVLQSMKLAMIEMFRDKNCRPPNFRD
ncbi:hypothetical protein EBB07_10720 [Paenibacillaceae bacterium]|nr:hypothetical protein EBB07_10720 [Paenibacillaceae bacterium]